MTTDRQIYEFRVAEHLDSRWSAWFGDPTIAHHDDGTCTLTCSVVDQAQLHGILARLRDIGATLLSVQTFDSGDETAAHSNPLTTERRPTLLH